MAAVPIGISGTSLALGIFNTTQIASLKSQIESLSQTPTKEKTEFELPETPSPSPIIEVEEIPPLEETSFGDASSTETLELQEKIVELERFANSVSTRSIQNSNNVTIKGDELNRLSTFVTEALVSVRERISSAENSISISESNIGLNLTSIGDIEESIRQVNERIDLSAVNISDIGSGVTGLQQRMEASESNAVELSSQITKIVLSADATGDNVSLLDALITDTKDSLESLIDSWNNLSAVAFVNNGKLKATALETDFANIAFKHNSASESALHWTNNLTKGEWSSFLANESGKAPDGTDVVNFGDVTGWGLRTRLGSTNDGFVLETNTGSGIFSVSGNGILDLGSNCRMADLFSNASFSHRDRYTVTDYSLIQNGNGQTQVNSSSGQRLLLNIGGETRVRVETDTSFTVLNAIGTNEVHNTHFNNGNVGENLIRAAEGKGTHFSFGKKGSSVSITDGEISIAGTAVLEKLQELEAKVNSLESNAILEGDTVHMNNNSNGRYLRKDNGNTNAVVDSTSTTDTKTAFTISR